jgi:large subunit ribosomal protein L6
VNLEPVDAYFTKQQGSIIMSRVGKKPIPIPDKTKITYVDRLLTVEGDKGKLTQSINSAIDLDIDKGVMNVTMLNEGRSSRALQGLTRSLVANMITGVNQGFERKLEINGIGYRAELSGKQIILHVGYSNPVAFDLPEGISAIVEKNNNIKLSGIDKQKVGLAAAAIRRIRPPEPYKGKGIKYAEEHIRRKAGKTGTK